jgi:predicted amidophosphoribosyltransferase
MIRKWWLRHELRSMGVCPDCGNRMEWWWTYSCAHCLAEYHAKLKLREKALFEELKSL